MIASGGCFSPRIDPCGVTCSAGDPCPDQMTCSGGVCGGAQCRAGSLDAVGPCLGPSLSATLVDDFSERDIDPALWDVELIPGCGVRIDDETLFFSTNGFTCGVRSVRDDLCFHDDGFSLDLVDAGKPEDPELTIRIVASPLDWLELTAFNNATGARLSVKLSVDGVEQTDAPQPFTEADTLRLATHDGLLTIGRQDGDAPVVPLWTFDEPAWTSAVSVELMATGSAGTTIARVDNVNTPPAL